MDKRDSCLNRKSDDSGISANIFANLSNHICSLSFPPQPLNVKATL